MKVTGYKKSGLIVRFVILFLIISVFGTFIVLFGSRIYAEATYFDERSEFGSSLPFDVYDDGVFRVTNEVDGWINGKSGNVTCKDKIKIENLTENKVISFNSVRAELNDGFESAVIGTWLVKNVSGEILFSGGVGDNYVPSLKLNPGEIKEFSVATTLNGLEAGKLVNQKPFRIVYDYVAQDKDYKVNYVVSVYGIGQDEVDAGASTAGLTFGPAVGEDVSCLDVDGSEHHSQGMHCIHEDSWEEIIANCEAGNWDLYSECIDYGCTKNIELKLNDSIEGDDFYKNKTASVLFSSINSSYRKWNDTYDISSTDPELADWATSRIRATLNGKTGSESSWAGTDCLDSTNCLLSCFPSSLQSAIKAKYYKVPTNWSTSYSTKCEIIDSVNVEDKLWLMNAEEVYGSVSAAYGEWGKDQYQRNARRSITISNAGMNKGFNESLSAADYRWLRCPHRGDFWSAGYVNIRGYINNYSVNGRNGLSACFCLGSQAKPEPTSTLNYMVNIYGIGQDAVDSGAHTAGLTFGPAVGETADCLHIDGSAEHGKASGGHCICEDSWDEIIKNCNEGHADYYSDCLDYHCAKSVPITLNSTIGTQPTTDQYASVLCDSINESYREWNDSYSSSGPNAQNWSTSRIRATLNGKTGSESRYAGSGLLDSTNCLLSCFPTNLANAIKTKYYQVPVTWQTSSSTIPPYKIDTSTYVNDKLWFMNVEEVCGTSAQTFINGIYWEWGKAQYKRNLDAGITTSAYSNNIGYNESSSAGFRWLRCPDRNCNFGFMGVVSKYGGLNGHSVNGSNGLSACFCLGTSGDVAVEDMRRLGLSPLDEVNGSRDVVSSQQSMLGMDNIEVPSFLKNEQEEATVDIGESLIENKNSELENNDSVVGLVGGNVLGIGALAAAGVFASRKRLRWRYVKAWVDLGKLCGENGLLNNRSEKTSTRKIR